MRGSVVAERYRQPSFAVSIVGAKTVPEGRRVMHFLTVIETADAVVAEDAREQARRQFEAANPGFAVISTIHEALEQQQKQQQKQRDCEDATNLTGRPIGRDVEAGDAQS